MLTMLKEDSVPGFAPLRHSAIAPYVDAQYLLIVRRRTVVEMLVRWLLQQRYIVYFIAPGGPCP
jgi:hypothetical protein